MSANPSFVNTPNVGIAVVSAANTARDGTGTLATIWTPGASGGRIDKVVLAATVTTTEQMFRLFIHDGTNARLLLEVPIRANTASQTNPVWSAIVPLDLVLPTGYSLRGSVHVAEAVNAIAVGGNF